MNILRQMRSMAGSQRWNRTRQRFVHETNDRLSHQIQSNLVPAAYAVHLNERHPDSDRADKDAH